MAPAPVPTTKPHNSTSCQDSRMKVVSATPVASSASALTMVRRRPKRSMNEAANGPITP